MIKVYVMATCPDCTPVIEQLAGNPDYLIVDIGEHVRNLKEFLQFAVLTGCQIGRASCRERV